MMSVLASDKWWRRATLAVQWAQFGMQAVQMAASFVIALAILGVTGYIAFQVPEILEAVRLIGPGSAIVSVGARGVDAVQRGTAHLNLTDIVSRSVPADDAAAAGYLTGAGHVAATFGELAQAVARSGIIEDVAVGIRFGLGLSEHRETAMFGEASAHIADFVSARAQDGGLKEGFLLTKELVLDVVTALRDPENRETLVRGRRLVDEIAERNAIPDGLAEASLILRQIREHGAVDAAVSLEHVLANLTTAYRQLRDDLSGGIVLQLPSVGRARLGDK